MLRTGFLLGSLLPAVAAGQPASSDAEPHLSISGYFQPQFERHAADGRTTDRAFFRRMVLTLDVRLARDWSAEFQIDAGPVASGEDRLIVKNAHLQYRGCEDRGVLLTLGNQKMPFSRSLLASSARRGLIERPFAGDRSLGSPGRALALKVDGWHLGQTVYWSAGLASSRQSPDPEEVRVDGTAEAGRGWNEGPLAGGRIELHPLGEMPRDQGDLDCSPLRFTIGGGAYGWWNDDDMDRHGSGSVDAARIVGVEVSGGLRGSGLSVDAEFEHIVSHAVEPLVTLGLYTAGIAAIDKGSIEAGYMVVPRRLEALAAVEQTGFDRFERQWRRLAAGMNWYLSGHSIKLSFMHRESFNERGVGNRRSRVSYVQTHIAF